MGYKTPNKMFIPFINSAMDPGDGTTYAIVNYYTAKATTTNRAITLPCDGRITAVALRWDCGTVGSNEAVEYYIRKNNTTDYTISTTVDQSASSQVVLSNLNIPFVAGDYFWIKNVNPAWVTNPLQVRESGIILFECD